MLKLEKVEVRFQVKSVRKNFFARSLQKVSAGLAVCDPCADMISRFYGEILIIIPFFFIFREMKKKLNFYFSPPPTLGYCRFAATELRFLGKKCVFLF